MTLVSFLGTTLQSSLGWAQQAPTRQAARRLDVSDRRSLALEAPADRRDLASEAATNPAGVPTDPATRRLAREAREELAPPSSAGTVEQLSAAEAGAFAALSLPSTSAPIAAQAISLPSGAATVGGMGESFTAQLTTGVATFKVPFSFPQARGNTQPALNLAYSSSGGFGDAGVGWSLAGDPAISRQTDRGTPGYHDGSDFDINQDRFVFGGQELVPICTVSAGACAGALASEVFPDWAEAYQYFRPRIEGAFLRFFWSPDHRTWRVQSKDGQHLELGAPLDDSGYTGALEANPTRPSEIYRWHLVRQYDSHGSPDATPKPLPSNVILYRHREDGAIKYLSDVYYTPPAATPETTDLGAFAHHLHVEWTPRPDQTSSYRAGFLQQQKLRLARIDVSSRAFARPVSVPRELVRRYHATYESGAHASLLHAVQTEGRCDDAVQENEQGSLHDASCPRLPGLTFSYQHVSSGSGGLKDSSGLAFEPFNRSVHALGDRSPPHSLDEQLVALMDVDSDSLPDLVITAAGLYKGKHGLFLNGASGDAGFGAAQGMTVSGVPDVDVGVLSFSNANVSALDPDGDGTVNLLHMPAVKKYSVFTPQKLGSGFAWVGREIATAKDQDPKIDFSRQAKRIARADVNGDGLVDLVFSSATELDTFFALGRLPGGDTQFGHGAWASNDGASLSTEAVKTCLPWSATPIQFDDPEVRMADMNGDGLPDIVRLRAGQVVYWPGRGNGFWGTGNRDDCNAGSFAQDRHLVVGNPPQFGTTLSGGLELGDVNGDGLADVVEFRFDAVDVYLNENGQRFTDRQTLTDVPIKPNASRFVQITDLDGSGTSDLVWGHGYDYRYLDLTGGVQPYLLTGIDNGLGKLTELEYASSTKLMLAARKAGTPWKRTLPMAIQVVVRSTLRDQLEKVGRATGKYVTEYTYRDPLFDGRQREFRGFESADSRSVGDDDSPSVTTRSTFLLGECQASQGDVDVCSYANRWQDNWREALKGLPSVVETFDDDSVYRSTLHHRYELRQLYAGRDGRRVTVAYTVGQDSFIYDTAAFVPANGSVALDEVQVNLTGIQQNESRAVRRRADTGTVRLRGSATFDDFGNQLTQVADGCVQGCETADESITRHTTHTQVAGDASGWLFRPETTFVTGSVHAEHRAETRHAYDAAGDLTDSFATLSGTLALDRFRAGGAVAPAPADASAGTDTPVEIQTLTYTHDEFGNVTEQRAPLGRCRSIARESVYADLALSETTYGGALDVATGCGVRAFTTTATYDRGLSVLLTTRDITGQPAKFEFDRFGRLTAKFFTDPEHPGQLALLPSATYEYLLTEDASSQPYSIVVVHEQNGEQIGDAHYHDTYSYLDGLGRPIVVLSEADSLLGDGGDFVAGDVKRYSSKGDVVRAYEPFFWDGEPLEFPPALTPPTSFVSQATDAFGRPILSYGLDGHVKAYVQYHALSKDAYDALDLEPGPHQGSYTTIVSDGHGRLVKSIERIHAGAGNQLEQRLQLTEHLPTGEVTRLTQRRAGSPDVVRWLRYDSQGRMVLNVEPNTTKDFTADENADPSSFKALRYAYNDVGELVGTSDARGCGINYFHDTAGRLIAEDYSPCESNQAPYSPPDFQARTGIETLYHYDTADTSLGEVADDAEVPLAPNEDFYFGRAVSVSGRGARSVVRYDARGRTTGCALQVAKPGRASDDLDDRYAPRWYLNETKFDAAGRSVESSTGATTSELLGSDGKSSISTQYSERGVAFETSSSYGLLSTQAKLDADGRPLSVQLGDAASTQRIFTYDSQRRLKTAQTFRGGPELWTSPGYPISAEKTQQLLLEDTELTYDSANNVTAITDYRVPEDWPDSAKPVSKEFEYDDSYRLTAAVSHYPGVSDSWQSPHAAENAGSSDGPQPSPHVDFGARIVEQRFQYDHLGNLTRSTDDANGFFDRSLGVQEHGAEAAGPNRLVSASNRSSAAASPRKGDMETRYDASGNLTDLTIRRDGPCLPVGASCWQRFSYQFDELGRLDVAKRWDLTGTERTGHDDPDESFPARPADVELRNSYDAGGNRVIKTAVDPLGHESHTIYVNGSYELRRTWWSDGDYVQTPDTATVYVSGAGVRGRVLYSQKDLPSLSSGKRHLLLELHDYLGSNTSVIDHDTGELVEYSTYQPFGGADSDYRPARWGEFRESYKFSGKEEDVEVGLAYFGARFLVLGLNRWATPDPVTIHELRGDANPYAYVGGRPMIAVDPDGRELFTVAFIIAVAISVAISTTTYAATTNASGTEWWLGFGRAFAVGLVSGAVGFWVGAGVGGMFASASVGALVGGAAGGAAGAASGYLTSFAYDYVTGGNAAWSVCDNKGYSLCGFGISVGTGAAVGAVMGWTSEKLFGGPADAAETGESIKTTDQHFDSAQDAADWAESRFYERAVANDQEYHVDIIKTQDGSFRLSQATAGPSRAGYGQVEFTPTTPGPGETFDSTWHPHPTGDGFSGSGGDSDALSGLSEQFHGEVHGYLSTGGHLRVATSAETPFSDGFLGKDLGDSWYYRPVLSGAAAASAQAGTSGGTDVFWRWRRNER